LAALSHGTDGRPVFGYTLLDPQYSWHSGFVYWYRKLKGLVEAHARGHGCSLSDSLATLSQKVAFLELYPYHSENFGLPTSVSSRLRPAQLAIDYAQNVLLPRARQGKVTLVITRQAKLWRLNPEENVVVYGPLEARSAHLTPGTRGGAAILEALS